MEAETTGGWCLPEAQLAAAGIQVARAIYDTLTIPDNQNNYVPFLAQSVTPNSNYTVWTIKIRPGITFHDGTPLNAQVVKDNIDAYTGKTDSKNLLFRFEFDAAHWITDVKVTDPMTVQVDLKSPWVSFPSHLYSYGRMGIEAEAQLHAGSQCFKKMIGTGPFEFKGDWQPGDHLTVVKNPHYWRKDAQGNPLPYLDSITFRPITDPTRLQNGLKTGQFDLALTDSALVLKGLTPSFNSKQLLSDTDHNFPEVTYTIFNTTKPPFDNINARKAYAYAVNAQQYNQLRQYNLQTQTYGPFGTSVMGYVPLSGYPPNSFPSPQGDATQAKQFATTYQQQTGQPMSFTYLTANDADSLQSAQLIKSYMSAAGINMSIKQEEQSQNINDVIYGAYQASGWRNHPGFDPDDQWVWWHCYTAPAAASASEKNIGIGAASVAGNNCDNLVNFGHWNDAEINKDLETGRSNPDPAARKAAYEDLNKEFAKQYWNAWGYYSIWTIPYQPDIHNVLGPNLPTATSVNAVGAPPFPGLSSWVDVAAVWKG
jgi:peptide/nickel transport system substrate-binding protein